MELPVISTNIRNGLTALALVAGLALSIPAMAQNDKPAAKPATVAQPAKQPEKAGEKPKAEKRGRVGA